LNACLEEKEKEVFLLGLKHVTEAQGGVRQLSKSTGLNREHLFRMLSKNGNPRLDNLRIIADNFGWKLAFIKKHSRKIRKAA
jgi:probable addiction module antidote protein